MSSSGFRMVKEPVAMQSAQTEKISRPIMPISGFVVTVAPQQLHRFVSSRLATARSSRSKLCGVEVFDGTLGLITVVL